MRNAAQYDYKYWGFLKDRGWEIVSSPVTSGTANTDLANKKINVKPSVFRNPSLRVRRYVIPHEIWHALHGDLMNYECDDLRMDRDLNWKSAVEAVADSGCLFMDKSRSMRLWVQASVTWHGHVGYRYKMSDVKSQQALSVVEKLHQQAGGNT